MLVIDKINAALELADHTLNRPEFKDLHDRALALVRQLRQYEFWDSHDYVPAEPEPADDPELPLEDTRKL
jgi:hypothetical protein